MAHISLVNKAHDMVFQVIEAGDFVIDATVGNGHDTVFLAQTVGDTGHVFGFDVQQSALDSAAQRLQQMGLRNRVTLYLQSHENILSAIRNASGVKIKAAMFNLGYLPGSDKTVVTQARSTVAALESILPLLPVGGLISIVAYTGHQGGQKEAEAVLQWCETLDKIKYKIQLIESFCSSEKSPKLIAIYNVSP